MDEQENLKIKFAYKQRKEQLILLDKQKSIFKFDFIERKRVNYQKDKRNKNIMTQFKITVSPADALSKGREGLSNVAFSPFASDDGGKLWNSAGWDTVPEKVLTDFCKANNLTPDFVKANWKNK